jgi:SAM-dependent methyltransferase
MGRWPMPGAVTRRRSPEQAAERPRVELSGCGEGRRVIWLACRGWKVTAVDFSPVAIDRGRLIGERHGLHVDWVADAIPGPYQLVRVSPRQLEDQPAAKGSGGPPLCRPGQPGW